MRGLIITILVLCVIYSNAQTSEPCGHNDYINYLESIEKGTKEKADRLYFTALENISARNKTSESDTTYTLRVVFHVVYNNSTQNIPDSLIYQQLDILNSCYRRTNEDTSLTRDVFKPVASDVKIQFELAKVDPDGDSTSGITRSYTSLNSFVEDPRFGTINAERVKSRSYGIPAWDTDEYLNIWICDLSYQNIDYLLGYAYPPTSAPYWGSSSYVSSARQGVVVHYKTIGNSSFNTLTGNKTTVHEVGHYLGLRHIWGDARPGGDRCNENYDDFLDDTPLAGASSEASGCNYNKNTCNQFDDGDLPDQIENYMDYSPGTCQNMFTAQQAALMRENLRMFRPGIIETKEYPETPVIPLPAKLFTETTIYPNPANNILNVILNDHKDNSIYMLKIINMLGQPVFEQHLEPKYFQYIEKEFGLSGMYVYQIKEDGVAIAEDKIIFGKF